MRKMMIALVLMLAPASANANAGADLKGLVDDYWAMVLKETPLLASSLGVDTYAGQVGDYSLAGQDRMAKASEGFLARLNAIPEGQLSANDKIEYGILKRTLAGTIEATKYGQRAINFSTYSGWHQNFAGMADNLPFRTKADYERL